MGIDCVLVCRDCNIKTESTIRNFNIEKCDNKKEISDFLLEHLSNGHDIYCTDEQYTDYVLSKKTIDSYKDMNIYKCYEKTKNLENKISTFKEEIDRKMVSLEKIISDHAAGVQNVYEEFINTNILIKSKEHIKIYNKLKNINELIEENMQFCKKNDVIGILTRLESIISNLDNRLEQAQEFINNYKGK
ncbi:MAG: hypothetical protein ACYC6W_10850 [Nitrosotalea sp.]